MGSVAGRAEQEPGRAADYGCPHEGGVGGLRNVHIRNSFGRRAFFRRIGLASQQALVDKKILGFEHPAVGRHQVSCREQDDISGNEIVGTHRDLATVAQHLLLQRHGQLQLLGRLFSTMLLDAVEQHAQPDFGAAR